MDTALPSYTATTAEAPAYNADAPDALPAYNASAASAQPSAFVPAAGIDDKVPNHFKFNDQYVKVQVMPSELQAHLVLLGAFHRLREEVRTLKGVKADIPMEPDERYSVFLQRAVYRFEQWAVRMISTGEDGEDEAMGEPRRLTPNEVPPLDVMMVWHTYMLNPRTYYEDCLRKLPGLVKIGSFPLLQLAESIDQETLLPHPSSESRVAAFSSLTGQSFDPPTNTTSEETVTLFCPSCSEANSIPWITYKGDGYAQRAFACACAHCQFEFSRETLGVRKFFEDMENCMRDPDKYFLANTVVDYQDGTPVDPIFSKGLSWNVLSLREGLNPIRPEVLAKKIGWTMKSVEEYCRKGVLGKRNRPAIDTPRQLNIILAAYHHPGPFSMDLASAAIRQMGFVEKMVGLGFTEPGRWEDDNDTLTRCVVRYHHFLELMVVSPGTYVVPTLVPDHDDKVNQGALSDAYDKTAEAWKERFGVPYSVCGCLPPLKAMDISGGSGGGLSLFSKKGKSKAALEKPFENARPDLISPSDAVADQTHPSDHYAVAIMNPAEANMAQAQVRRRELAKRAKELEKNIEKGKASQWSEVMQKRATDHTPSFLCPVRYGISQGDCTALSGGGLRGNFSAGECCKANGLDGLCIALYDQARGGPLDSLRFIALMHDDMEMAKALGMSKTAVLGVIGAGPGGGRSNNVFMW
ncbi:hypothetical protein FS837_012288 [Tulasnella sp. UAMH 9824]|nr:hypothetical protein FS837_012288 [Tulasnella sp. UAMH 9824]